MWDRLVVQNLTSIGAGGGNAAPDIKNFHFLVKSRLTGANLLTDLYNFYVLLYAQLSYISVSNLTRFTSQVMELWLRNCVSVIYAKFFSAPCRKNYALDQKMIATFFNGLDEIYDHTKFGGD